MKPAGITDLTVSPGQRFETGCIATFSEGTTRHFVGAGKEATRAVADYCAQRAVKVVSLSTPRTIFRDLQGSRAATADGDTMPVDGRARPMMNMVNTPEDQMLAGIGRLDLLEERSAARAGAIHDPGAR